MIGAVSEMFNDRTKWKRQNNMRLDELRSKVIDAGTESEGLLFSPALCPQPTSTLSPSYPNYFNFNPMLSLSGTDLMRTVFVPTTNTSRYTIDRIHN